MAPSDTYARIISQLSAERFDSAASYKPGDFCYEHVKLSFHDYVCVSRY